MEWALTEDEHRPELAANAARLLSAWHSVLDRGITFHVNEAGDAWYTVEGQRRFLASVPGGFAWPDDDSQADDLPIEDSVASEWSIGALPMREMPDDRGGT